jgi:hypothetical protein
MCNEELLKNVRLACEENIPKGVEFAWCDLNGNVVRWSDLRAALETCCVKDNPAADQLPSPEVIKKHKANALLPDDKPSIEEETIHDV